ncbi:hypothetical protein RSAG8_10634, partial [Rhizoctonia solani AG-8 WAC10335]
MRYDRRSSRTPASWVKDRGALPPCAGGLELPLCSVIAWQRTRFISVMRAR